MQPDSAPFPLDTELRTATPGSFAKTTEAERGQTLLAHFLHFNGDDLFTEPGGMKRFNTRHAVPTAAGLIRDVLSYIHDRAGGADAVARTMNELHELATTDHDEYTPLDGGVLAGLPGSLTDKRLTQLKDNQTEIASRLEQLATHLGVQPRP
ncbi:hypothetical protein LRE75_03240 [Streptomyces sp. 372A]